MNNTERVKEMYAAFSRGDIPAIMDALADDVQWDFEAPAVIPYAGKRRGKTEVLGFFAGIGSSEQDQALTITEYIAEGDQVATFGRYASTVKSTGIRYDAPIAHFWEFRDGKVTRLADYTNTAATADAHAGVSR